MADTNVAQVGRADFAEIAVRLTLLAARIGDRQVRLDSSDAAEREATADHLSDAAELVAIAHRLSDLVFAPASRRRAMQ
jgi:hypothetical protein